MFCKACNESCPYKIKILFQLSLHYFMRGSGKSSSGFANFSSFLTHEFRATLQKCIFRYFYFYIKMAEKLFLTQKVHQMQMNEFCLTQRSMSFLFNFCFISFIIHHSSQFKELRDSRNILSDIAENFYSLLFEVKTHKR